MGIRHSHQILLKSYLEERNNYFILIDNIMVTLSCIEPGQRQPLASYQIRKIVVCACAGHAGTFSLPPRVSDHGTCVTHVPWCTPGSLASGFLWSRWRGKRSRRPQCMRNPQFYVSGKRPMVFSLFSRSYSDGLDALTTFASWWQMTVSRDSNHQVVTVGAHI